MPMNELRLEMNREQAEAHLKDQSPGNFVVRNSSKPGLYTLSIRQASPQKPYFHQLVQTAKISGVLKYNLQKSQRTFDSLEDLCEFYCSNKSPTLPCILKSTSTFGGGGGGRPSLGLPSERSRAATLGAPRPSAAAPSAGGHDMDHEPWFVGMLQTGRTQVLLADAPVGAFVIRESSSSMNSFVLACREASGVVEYKITNSGGMFGYDAQVGERNAQHFPTLQLLIDAAPNAITPAKERFTGEVRLASNLQKLKSREVDKKMATMQVTTVPQDFGLMDETWYVHTASVETAKSTLSGMAPGLFVIVPDEQGGLNYYTMVSVTRRGVECLQLDRMGGIYKSADGAICPTLGDAVTGNPGCTTPARFLFESGGGGGQSSTLGGRMGGGRPAGGRSPLPIKRESAPSYMSMSNPSSAQFEDDTIGGEHEYVNDNEIDAVVKGRSMSTASSQGRSPAAGGGLPDLPRMPRSESNDSYEDVDKTVAASGTPQLDGKQSYVNGDVIEAHLSGKRPTIEDGPSAWSVGTMSREDCKAALMPLPSGSFVVRESASDKGALVLVAKRQEKVVERKIGNEAGQYLIAKPKPDVGIDAFDSLIELLRATDIAESPVARHLRSGGDDADYTGKGELPPEETGAYVNVSEEDIEAAKRKTLSDKQDRKVQEELRAWEEVGDPDMDF